MTFALFLALAGWCWLAGGPAFLRWPALLLVVVVSSGHPVAAVIAEQGDPWAARLLPILLFLAALRLLLRQRKSRPRRSFARRLLPFGRDAN